MKNLVFFSLIILLVNNAAFASKSGIVKTVKEAASEIAEEAIDRLPKEMPTEIKDDGGVFKVGSALEGPMGGLPQMARKAAEQIDVAEDLEISLLRRDLGFLSYKINMLSGKAQIGTIKPREVEQLSIFNEMKGELIAKYQNYQKIVKVRSLEEIYEKGFYGRPLDEILKQSRRTDRIKVAVIDSGIDYNHPFLAYKIARPTEKEIAEIGHEKLYKAFQMYRHRDMVLSDIRELKKNIGHSSKRATAEKLERDLAEAEEMVVKYAVGWDFHVEDHLPYDFPMVGNTHGTHVAGIIARDTDDISILPIRHNFFVQDTVGLPEEVAFARKKGAKIVNLGVALPNISVTKQLDTLMVAEINSTFKAIKDNPDMLFVVSAGNNAMDNGVRPSFPSSLDLPNVISVAAVDSDNHRLLHRSNYGKNTIHVAAPGDDIVSSSSAKIMRVGEVAGDGDDKLTQEGYEAFSGTSMATPYVTRVAAKILYINPKLKPAEVIDIIKKTVTKTEHLKEKVIFGGVINEERALALAREISN